jgi:hypothetical protein
LGATSPPPPVSVVVAHPANRDSKPAPTTENPMRNARFIPVSTPALALETGPMPLRYNMQRAR